MPKLETDPGKTNDQANSSNLCHSCQKAIKSGESYWHNQEIPDQKICESCHQAQQTKSRQARVNEYLVHSAIGLLLIGLIV